MNSPKRILIVDDDPVVLKLLKQILSASYDKISSASSAREAIKFMSQSEYSCVVTDAVMPQETGYDLTRTIRGHAQWKHTPIIMLTRKRHPEDVQRAVKLGVNDYLLKPVDGQLLLEKIRFCIESNEKPSTFFELSVTKPGTLSFNGMVRTISETGIGFGLTFPIKHTSTLRLQSDVYSEIGIEPPLVRLVSCRENALDQDLPYTAQFSFIGITESDLMKIRSWVQRESIRRKK